jgi:hypothetical protein
VGGFFAVAEEEVAAAGLKWLKPSLHDEHRLPAAYSSTPVYHTVQIQVSHPQQEFN